MQEALDATQFRRRLAQLLSSFQAQSPNTACVKCVNCVASSGCTFCSDSESLVGCHYSVKCVMCSNCTHCRECRNLFNCQHCQYCDACSNCAYVVHSSRLSGCSYCFGCVGLTGADFFILNEPYRRAEYFEVTRKLTEELANGWR